MSIAKQSFDKKRQIASLIVNLAIVVLEIIGTRLSILTHGWSMFQYYTIDSNLLTLAACAVCAAYTAINLKNGTVALPRWVKTLKYLAVCCLAVTFVVVVCVLSPTSGKGGYRMMLLFGSMLYHHLLCPVLAMLSFLFLELDPPLPKRHALIALIPTLIYAVIILLFNITKAIVGPYPFLHVYEQSVAMSVIWCVIILGGAYLLAWLILLAGNKATAKWGAAQ
ncbi:MAG TPA: hypothetical protein PK537_12920 [Candidatus Limiplasma sp.]|nr:hypothetical protein [Candidatus Limiplasma sp.]